MMTSFNPVRECWFDAMYFNGGVVSNAVPLRSFVNAISVLALIGPGLAAPVTITFEGATEDPADICQPLAASWAPLNTGGFCTAQTALSITINPAVAPYTTDLQQLCREVLQCPAHFVRARLSAAAPAVAAIVVAGKARNLDQV